MIQPEKELCNKWSWPLLETIPGRVKKIPPASAKVVLCRKQETYVFLGKYLKDKYSRQYP